MQAAVAAGALTYERLVTLYLARIDAYDKNGPRLNAMIEINHHALETARALDAERRRSGLRSPLHGIPIAVKDNFDVSDMPSAGGNIALAGTFPPRDATVIRRLREAGAIIFLKTNMDELALGNQGLSSLGGQMLNPYDLTRESRRIERRHRAFRSTLASRRSASAPKPACPFAAPRATTRSSASRRPRGWSAAPVCCRSLSRRIVSDRTRKSVADAALLLTYLRGIDPDDLSTAASAGHVDGGPLHRASVYRAALSRAGSAFCASCSASGASLRRPAPSSTGRSTRCASAAASSSTT